MTPLARSIPHDDDRLQRDRLDRLARLILAPDEGRTTLAPCLDCRWPTDRRSAAGPLCEPCYSGRLLQARAEGGPR